MKLNKIIKAILLFLIIGYGIQYGAPKILPAILVPSFEKAYPADVLYKLGGIVAACYLIMSYRKSFKSNEINTKKAEYCYNLFNDEEKKTFDEMGEEEKACFIKNFEEKLDREERNKLQNKVFDWEHGYAPKAIRILRPLLMLTIVGSIAFTAYDGWPMMEETFDFYIAGQYEPIPDGVYHFEGLPALDVQLATENGQVLKRDVYGVASLIAKTQPQFLLNECSVIHIWNQEKFDAVKQDAQTYALSDPSDDSITVHSFDSGQSVGTVTQSLFFLYNYHHDLEHTDEAQTYALSDPSDDSITVHSFDSGQSVGTVTQSLFFLYNYHHDLEHTDEAISLYNQYANVVSNNSEIDIAGFLAYSAELYWTKSGTFKSDARKVWEYMDRIFQGNI